jgi:O-antigen/teichoic acid export membrane protein
MSTDQNTLIKHSTIYAVADISRKLISFIMLPIYTRFLTPEDYGAVELLSMVITIAEILLGARLGHAIFRFYYKYDAPLQKKQVLSTALIITLFASVFALFILILSANKLSMFVFNTYELQGILSLFALRVVLIPIEEYAFLLLRIHKKVWHFFTFSIIKTILQLSLNIYFVVVLNKGVEGVVLSSLYSGAIMSIPALFYLFRTTGMNFNVEIAKKLILFSAPLWGSAILGFYLGLSDRFFIQKMIDLNEVGIYALSVKLAMILMILVWWPFEKAWEGVRYEIYNSPEGSKLQFMNVFSTINLVSILVGLGICLFSREVITPMDFQQLIFMLAR